jgi:thioglycine synthase
VLTDRGRDELGADAWFDSALAGQIVGELYPLYREPSRHALARS